MTNISNLRKDAIFSTQIFRGVRWVPVNTLGRSRYSDLKMKGLVWLKQFRYFSNDDIIKKIHTLYEAIQFLQVGNFEVMCDNVFFNSGGVEWELHKSGYDGLEYNKGCCASLAATIYTLLNKNYDSIKLIVIIALHGSCHVLNYIESNGKKYIIDAYAMTNKYKEYIPFETGKFRDFVSSKIMTGVLLEIDELQNFFDFYRRYFIKRNDCYDFFLVDDGVVPCISLDRTLNNIELIIKGKSMHLISKDTKEHNLAVKYI